MKFELMLRRRWLAAAINSGGALLCLSLAYASWPDPFAGFLCLVAGMNVALVLFNLGFNVVIPFRVAPPTPEQLAQFEGMAREALGPIMDKIAREHGLERRQPPTMH